MITRLKSPAAATLALLGGFALAVCLRMLVGGAGVAQSASAGLVFAAALSAMGIAAGTRVNVGRRAVFAGLLGGLALCVPALVVRLLHGPAGQPLPGFLAWASVVTVVAVAEEYFLRGALFDAANRWLGETGAIFIAAAAFAALHLSLYGAHVLPLDFAVGLWLGALRIAGRYWTAPAIAHTVADLLAWWLR